MATRPPGMSGLRYTASGRWKPAALGTSSGKDTAPRARSRETRRPRPRLAPAPAGRVGAVGSGPPRWIATPGIPSRRATASLAPGVATTIPAASTSRASAATAILRQAGWRGSHARTGPARTRGSRRPSPDRAGAGAAASLATTASASGGVGGCSRCAPRSVRARSSSSSVISRTSSLGRQGLGTVVLVVQGRPEPGERSGGARLDGPAPAAEHLGRLRLGQVEEEPGGDHQAVPLRHAGHGRQQGAAALAGQRRRLGRRGRVSRGAGLGDPHRQVVLAAAGAPAVARLVGDDRQQPGPERRVRAEAVQRVPGLDQALLGGVLGVGGAAGDQAGCPVRELLVPAHEGLVGTHVSPSRPFDELDFLLVQWTALHCLLSGISTPPRGDRFPAVWNPARPRYCPRRSWPSSSPARPPGSGRANR